MKLSYLSLALALALALAACNVGELQGPSSQADAAPAAVDANPAPADAPALPDAAVEDQAAMYAALPLEGQQVFDAINGARVAAGLEAVLLRATLICSATRHSADIGAAELCSHTGSDGSTPALRTEACGGGGWSGEIVACEYRTASSAVEGWLASPGHSDILLGVGKREVGVAMSNNYWTAIFDD